MVNKEELKEAIEWAEECVQGHRRSKKEIHYLHIFLEFVKKYSINILIKEITK